MKAVIAPPRVPSPSKNQRDFLFADMAKLADALDLGSSEATRAGSSPVIRREKRIIRKGYPSAKKTAVSKDTAVFCCFCRL